VLACGTVLLVSLSKPGKARIMTIAATTSRTSIATRAANAILFMRILLRVFSLKTRSARRFGSGEARAEPAKPGRRGFAADPCRDGAASGSAARGFIPQGLALDQRWKI
jgi:hypothetical protein